MVAHKHSTVPRHADDIAAETVTGGSCAATGDLRLVGGETSADGGSQFGRLEVFNAGGWGTVCDRSGDGFGRQRNLANFTPASVDVACQQLGFIDGAKTEIAVRFGCACAETLELVTPSGFCAAEGWHFFRHFTRSSCIPCPCKVMSC